MLRIGVEDCLIPTKCSEADNKSYNIQHLYTSYKFYFIGKAFGPNCDSAHLLHTWNDSDGKIRNYSCRCQVVEVVTSCGI